jgi:hypothetical protein
VSGWSMTVDDSDEMLRRIAFGRGATPAEAGAAADELHRRSRSGMDEAGPAAGTPQADEDTAASVATGDRVASRGGVRLLLTAVVAGAVGVAGTVGYYRAVAERAPDAVVASAGPDLSAGRTTSGTAVTDSSGSRVLYEVPEPAEPADPADSAGWWTAPQTEQDALPFEMTELDAASSRYVGRIRADGGAWIARALDGDYCAVITLEAGGGAAYSCTEETVFSETGTYVGSGERTLFWNPSSVILSTTGP